MAVQIRETISLPEQVPPIGMGDKFDEKNGIELTAGGYGEAPAKMNYYRVRRSNPIMKR